MADTASSEALLKQAHDASIRNEAALQDSDQAGCFHCCVVFAPAQITDWVREQVGCKTAICPHCGIDSVLPSKAGFPLTPEFLRAMEQRWFGC